MNDERWLWPYFRDAIRVLRPRYAIIENVPGLLTSDDGRAFNRVLSDLAALGYDAEWAVLPASFVGAPQTRERLFIVSYPAEINGVTRNMLGESEERITQVPIGGLFSLALVAGWEPSDFWAGGEPAVAPLVDGTPRVLAESSACGNAVVPQVAEYVGRCVMLHANEK